MHCAPLTRMVGPKPHRWVENFMELTDAEKLTIYEALQDRARLFESYGSREWRVRAQEVLQLAVRIAREAGL